MVFTATKAAVSVRNLLSPKEIGVIFFAKHFFISSDEKSPSGPIKMVVFSDGFTTDCNKVFSCSSQCAIQTCPLISCFKKSFNFTGSFSLGNVNFKK